MSLLSVAKNCLSILKAKIGEADASLVTKNPESILTDAIQEAKDNLNTYVNKLAELKTKQREVETKVSDLRAKLVKIQKGISRAQKDGAVESVKKGTFMYKETERDLESLLDISTEINTGITEIEQFIFDAKKEIDTLEVEKTRLMVQLQTANTKEEIMNIKSSLGTTKAYNSRFAEVRQSINNKVEHVKSLESIQKGVGGKDKYFDNI